MRRGIRVVWVLTLILTVAAQAIPGSAAHAAPPYQAAFDPVEAQRSTVYVMQVYTNPVGQTIISCVGSGTLVSAEGLILTNAHLAAPSASCRSDRIVIGLTVRVGEPPVPKYYAEAISSNLGWDLAVSKSRTLSTGCRQSLH
jgi:hypothetical protein